jgi:outer membrane lipoprotein-sorting protein
LLAQAASLGDSIESGPLVSAVLQSFRSHAGFEAEFTQLSEWIAFGESDTSSGKLIIAPPTRFLIDYSRPPGQRIGSDGHHVWTYIPEERQVLRAEMDATASWLDPLILGLESPAEARVPVARDSHWGRVATIPLSVRPEWSVVDVYARVAIDSRLPVGYGYTDAEGNRIRFDFLTARFVSSIDPARFEFAVPPGYELFDAGR